jgi:hypothetical protein
MFASRIHELKVSSLTILFSQSEVSDITEEGTIDFFFSAAGHKHTFQATTLTERDNWVSVLKTKITEAKELVEPVKNSEEYKEAHSKLSKPAVVTAVATPKKSTEVKKEEKAEAKEEKKEEKTEAKEEKKDVKDRKSRSASRKRTSIFGNINFGGKKEEKTEAKEETPVVAAPATEEPVAAATEPAAPVETAPAPVAEAAPAVETTAPAATEARPAASKRNSIFGTLKNQFSGHKEKKPEAETAPAVPAKDASPVSESAPVIPAVESTEPLATSVASPATVPTEETAVTNGESKATETPAAKPAEKTRKSSLPWLSKKEKATTSDEEGEKPKSPFAKLRATVKGKPKAAEKADKAPEKTEEAVEEPAKKKETPAEPVAEPTPVATSTPQVAATA